LLDRQVTALEDLHRAVAHLAPQLGARLRRQRERDPCADQPAEDEQRDSPEVDLKATLEKLALRKIALGKATLGWTYGGQKNALKLAMTSTNGGQLQAKAEVGLDLGLTALKQGFAPLEAPVRGQLVSRGFDLSFLSGAHATLRTVGGRVTADASADGQLGSPNFVGKLAWKQGRLGIAGLSEFRDIELVVDGNNQQVTVEKLDARSGAGTLEVRGKANRQSQSAWAFKGSLDTHRLPVVADDQLRFILDVRSRLEGELSPLLWNVRRLEIPDATVHLPVQRKKDTQSLDRPDDIVLVRDGVALGPRPTRWKKKVEDGLAGEMERQKSRVMRVNLFAPRNLWVRGTDVNLEVGLSDGFAVEYDRQLYLNGTVKVVRGKVSVIGRDFEVQRDSTVTFSGPPAAPSLNVTAAYNNPREKVTVFATLVGSGEDFSLRTSSQPALSESEIYTLLATGRRSLRRGSGSAISGEQSLSVVGGLMAAQLKWVLAEELPVEMWVVVECWGGAGGVGGARLEAGE
jgi:translocation and assembly module TamB